MNGRARRWVASLGRWEVLLLAVLIALVVFGTTVSPVFLTGRNFANAISAVIEVAIMSLPMALIIIAGEIDLSVESMVGLSASILGYLYAAGVPIELAIVVVLIVGALGGLLNGFLVTRIGLPSLVVTLGTLALYRGLALVVLESRGISQFPEWFTGFGFGTVPGLPIPWPFVVYLALAFVLAVLLHGTWVGREIYAIGKNQAAARFSGVRVARIKLWLFVLSGTVAALAGRDPHGEDGQRTSGRRHRAHARGRDDRVAGRRRYLRRPGHDPGRRPCLPDIGGAGQCPAPDECVLRHPEHRRRTAADRVGGHPHSCSPGQGGIRPGSRRSALADRVGRRSW